MGNVQAQVKQTLDRVPAKMMEQQKEVMLKQRELQLAMNLAGAKDRMEWLGAFTATYTTLIGAAVARGKASAVALGPLLPLTFVLAWHYDFVYGTKLDRMRAEAERVLREDAGRLNVPRGNLLITPEHYAGIFLHGRRDGVAKG